MSESTQNETTSNKPSEVAESAAEDTVKNTVEETMKVSESATASESATVNATVNANTKPVKSGRGLSVFAVLLALLSLAASGFLVYQTQLQKVQQESSLAVGVTQIGGQVSRIGDVVNQLKQAQQDVVTSQALQGVSQELSAAFNTQVAELQTQHDELDSQFSDLNSELDKGEQDYQLNEVTQLLKLANHNVHFGEKTAPAIAALNLADGLLKELAEPAYLAVRKKIAEEINALKNVEKPDVTTLSASLSNLSQQIPALPLLNEPEVVDNNVFATSSSAAAPETADSPPEKGWRVELNRMWHDILNAIRVQRVDQPPKPLLVPEQRYFLNQNLQLTLSAAQLALLQSNQAVWTQQLNDAAQWLAEYFDLSDDKVAEVHAELSRLQAISIESTMPPVTGSYDLLQALKNQTRN